MFFEKTNKERALFFARQGGQMFEIRLHGRGGQGAVTAAEILALAAFIEGKESQSFPQFGSERRGAPVAAFCRIDNKQILIHSGVYSPDCVVVFDISLLKNPNIIMGLKKDGWLVLNTSRNPEDFKHLGEFNIATVDATSIATRHKLGSETAPIVNTTILGAIAKATGVIRLSSLAGAIRERMGKKFNDNYSACEEAYTATKVWEGGEENV